MPFSRELHACVFFFTLKVFMVLHVSDKRWILTLVLKRRDVGRAVFFFCGQTCVANSSRFFQVSSSRTTLSLDVFLLKSGWAGLLLWMCSQSLQGLRVLYDGDVLGLQFASNRATTCAQNVIPSLGTLGAKAK